MSDIITTVEGTVVNVVAAPTSVAVTVTPTVISVGAVTGKNGDSAYQQWIRAGNSGTTEDFLTAISGVSGYSGLSTSGYSGFSGYSGLSTSGYSGFSGYSGLSTSGYSGFSGYSGSGISGYSGSQGPAGADGIGTVASVGTLIGTTATTEDAVADTDTFGFSDASDSQILKKTTWSNIKSLLQTWANALYVIAGGKSGGQTINGSTLASENLILSSTAHATKGKILFGTSAYDEVNNRLGIGTTSPTAALTLVGNSTGSIGEFYNKNASGYAGFELQNQTGGTANWKAFFGFSNANHFAYKIESSLTLWGRSVLST